MATDASLQFKEPANVLPHPTLHPSTSTDSSSSTDSTNTSASHAPLERQGSLSKVASIAKKLVESPKEEKEHLQMEKTLQKEVKKGDSADVGTLEA
ncbi:hypothetical protein N0V94_000960 [Neodidymelliopsis sp. IMI 364377]|nr:hypothetical protein N0V94_000960 [Neodidymelliopsis sp. IMI 364377]